jgi:hypothetical protein
MSVEFSAVLLASSKKLCTRECVAMWMCSMMCSRQEPCVVCCMFKSAYSRQRHIRKGHALTLLLHGPTISGAMSHLSCE